MNLKPRLLLWNYTPEETGRFIKTVARSNLQPRLPFLSDPEQGRVILA
jgi:hypothetical protein